MLFGRETAARVASGIMLITTAAVMLAFAAVFALHYAVPVDEAKTFVDIGDEANLPTWWNAVLLFLVAALAATAAAAGKGKLRLAWSVVAAASAYLSVDETAGLHERLSRPLVAAGVETPTYPWLVLGGTAAALGVAVLCVAGRVLPPETARRLALALACYGTGALVVEAFNGWVREVGPGVVFSAGLIVEEGLEMVACIIAAAALIDYLVQPEHSRALVEAAAAH